MKWTTEPPTEPGWYWEKPGNANKLIVHIGQYKIDMGFKPYVELGYSWAGPIPEPEDA